MLSITVNLRSGGGQQIEKRGNVPIGDRVDYTEEKELTEVNLESEGGDL